MEVVRARCLVAPSFSSASTSYLEEPRYTYKSNDIQSDSDKKKDIERRTDQAQPLTTWRKSLKTDLPSLHRPANIAALRCDWHHQAVLSLIMAHSFPGTLLEAEVDVSQTQLSRTWQHLAVRAADPHACLTSLKCLKEDHSENFFVKPSNVCVGFQDDWLEISPTMLPLWTAAPFEPYAGQKPVQFFVLCPDDHVHQARLFLKDVGANYELCNLGIHHSALQPSWLYTFSTGCSPGCATEQPCSLAQQAWQQLSLEQRYLQGLRSAAERLQHGLLSTPLQLQQEELTLETEFDSTPVIYIICPFEGKLDCSTAAVLEVAQCLAPCTPLGTGCQDRCFSDAHGDAVDLLAAMQAASTMQIEDSCSAQIPRTPEPGKGWQKGGTPSDGVCHEPVAASAAAMRDVAAGGSHEGRLHGAAHGLFNQALGRGLLQQGAQPVQERAPPVDLTLQVVNGHCLADLSGQSAKSMAFEVYTKIQRKGIDSASSCAPTCTDDHVPIRLEPPFILSPAAQQPEVPEKARPQAEVQEEVCAKMNGEPHHKGLEHEASRILHCCYALPQTLAQCISHTMVAEEMQPPLKLAPEVSDQEGVCQALLVPVSWTDSCGEVMHFEVLKIPLSNDSVDCLDAESLTSDGGVENDSVYGQICRGVLNRSLDVLRYLKSASQPKQMPQSVVISRLGSLSSSERTSWSRLVAERQNMLPENRLEQHLSILCLSTEASSRQRISELLCVNGKMLNILREDHPTCRLAGSSAHDNGPILSIHQGQTVLEATYTICLSEGPAMLGIQVLDWTASSFEHAFSVVLDVCRLSMLNAAYCCLLRNGGIASGTCATSAGANGPLAQLANIVPFHAQVARNMLKVLCCVCSS